MSVADTHAFTGGRIVSMDPGVAEPELLVVTGDRIVAAGERALLARHPDAELHTLDGRTLLPGFIDAHNHLSIAALHPLWADVGRARTADDVRAALRAAADAEPEAGWVRAANWELDGPLTLTRHDLDAVGLDRPIVVAHFSLHQAAVCSRALDLLGIGRLTPDPTGGEIGRGADGLPSGLLVERAWSAAHAASMQAYRDPDRWADLFAARGRALWRDGITAVHDAACGPEAERVYRAMARAGALPLSVLVMPHAEAILSGPDADRLDGPPTGDGDEWLRVGPAKLFADGGIAPAIDVMVGGARLTYGFRFDDLPAHASRLAERGFGVAVHAMGNLGLAATVETFAGLRRRGAVVPLRVEHATLAAPAHVGALADLGAFAVVQPGFVHHLGSAVELLVPDEETWMPFRSLLDAGVPLAASSDDPCAFHEPLRTSAVGATRRTASGNVLRANQAVGYERWLQAYTDGAARAGGQERERGTLTPGKRADLVVVDGVLEAESPPRVVETWVAGRRVWVA
jgi:hypothetical protein